MKKMFFKMIAVVVSVVVGLASVSAPVMANGPMTVFGDTNSTNGNESGSLGKENANILKDCASREDGIMCILELVIEIMSIGVGILGVIGISVSGIQYLTAGGSEEKTRKAKRRLLEIVIGLAVYAVVYALLKWLLPSFK